jgi:GT2 family glycosyltransferase
MRSSKLPTVPISIIVVTYNYHSGIREALTSLERTSYPDLEIVVVDNYSSDGTWDVVQTWARTATRSNNVLQGDTDHCLSVALNLGVRACRGSLIAVVNQDVYVVDPRWLPNLAEALAQDQRLGVVGPTLVEADGRSVQTGGLTGLFHTFYRNPLRGSSVEDLPDTVVRVDSLVGAVLLFRREVLTAVGGFDEALRPILFEDTDVLWRVKRYGAGIGWVPRSKVIHMGGSSFGRNPSLGSQSIVRWYCRHALRCLIKNAPASRMFGEVLLLLLVTVGFHRTRGIHSLLAAARWNLDRLEETMNLRRNVTRFAGTFESATARM